METLGQQLSLESAALSTMTSALASMDTGALSASVSLSVQASQFLAFGSPLLAPGAVLAQETAHRLQEMLTMTPTVQGQVNAVNRRLKALSDSAQAEIKKLSIDLQGTMVKAMSFPALRGKVVELRQRIALLQKMIKPPINFSEVTQKINGILTSTSALPDKWKAIERLRVELGLRTGEMRTMFTQRLSDIYQNSIDRLRGLVNTVAMSFPMLVSPTTVPFPLGIIPNVPVSNWVPTMLSMNSLSDILRTEINRLNALRQPLPPPKPKKKRGFWKKFKKAFKKVGQALRKSLPVLKRCLSIAWKVTVTLTSKTIPVLSWAQSGIAVVKDAVRGRWGSMVRNMVSGAVSAVSTAFPALKPLDTVSKLVNRFY